MSLRIQPFDDLVYEDRYNNDDDDSYDSEDSNDENYAGNEYPDEDDDAALNSDRENDDMDDVEPSNLSLLLQRIGLGKFHKIVFPIYLKNILIIVWSKRWIQR